ncbi:acetyltransferase [Bacillus sp. FJAT-25509]|uniref:acetyltransferase n=1 Tax=Bacillus sp. FJAT-25509 TaxID=1712029 RepID=UPI0006FDFA26|nr:acetyltransferase [Bacillus sp. FJAT-25509]KQL39947.1 acetyltransferase [Bacillus sp. FJAT-25509]
MKIIILGNGGHSKVVQEMVNSLKIHKITAILDDRYEFERQENGMIYAPFSSIKRLMSKDTRAVIAVGDNFSRKKIVCTLKLRDDQYISIFHPTAVISKSAIIGNGTVVMPKSVINAEAFIGNHCIINTGSIVEHDNNIGDFSHVSPNSTLTGNVTLGEGVHIGASATIIPGISIGEWSVVGAGSTVIKNIPSYSKAVGTPTRIIKKIKS